ncbi:ribonuclease BN (tRNA processing enzyme) [Paenibacillus sp. DS2015]|uniref:MBL fold metallo-hydrolase n=1 Tax=Paenibacillus sp. DS2015 TaxID=3373917 RepID=UPI003D1E7F08
MSIQLQMLGTGSAFARRYFNNNALLYDDEFTLLIDCGVTAPMALHQLNVSFDDIDAVLITHIHADHVGGLEELAFTMKFKYKRKMILYIADTLIDTLWEHTLRGGLYQDGEIMTLEDIFIIRPLSPGQAQFISNQITLEMIPTEHIPGKKSYSLYVNEHIFYSADMTFSSSLLAELVHNRACNVILHDCQLTGPGEVHTTLQELLTLPEDIQRIIYLMHYGDNKDEFVGATGLMTFLEQHLIYDYP